jgi:hypothetical protein
MPSISPWWAIPATIIFAWVIYRLVFRRAGGESTAADPDVTKASPKIGTTMRIDQRQEDSAGAARSYYLVPVIQNQGELPARQLKGGCRVFSPVHKSQERIIPIRQENLGASPFELDGVRLDGFLIEASRPHDALFHVAIDIEYHGVSGDKPLRYSARYAFDQKSLQMIKVHEQG